MTIKDLQVVVDTGLYRNPLGEVAYRAKIKWVDHTTYEVHTHTVHDCVSPQAAIAAGLDWLFINSEY